LSQTIEDTAWPLDTHMATIINSSQSEEEPPVYTTIEITNQNYRILSESIHDLYGIIDEQNQKIDKLTNIIEHLLSEKYIKQDNKEAQEIKNIKAENFEKKTKKKLKLRLHKFLMKRNLGQQMFGATEDQLTVIQE